MYTLVPCTAWRPCLQTHICPSKTGDFNVKMKKQF